MRSSQWLLSTNPLKIVDALDDCKIFMIRNRAAAGIIYVQFGGASQNADAWPVLAGDSFVLDPAAPKESIFVWSDTAGIANTVIIG